MSGLNELQRAKLQAMLPKKPPLPEVIKKYKKIRPKLWVSTEKNIIVLSLLTG